MSEIFHWQHSDGECENLLKGFLLEPVEAFHAIFALPVEDRRDALDVIGAALWDVFSDNHTVFDADGAYHLGSFRGSGGFIAEVMNRRYPDSARFDYLNFYMGSLGEHHPHLETIYRWIFTGLKNAACDWFYSFPRLYLVRFEDAEVPDDMLEYDPGKALEAELEQSTSDAAHNESVDQLNRAYEDDVRAARDRQLPIIVAAYRAVYGRFPNGWPHPDM